MKYILHQAKDFKLEMDAIKYTYSRSNYSSRVTHGIGKTKVTCLIGGYWKGSGQG